LSRSDFPVLPEQQDHLAFKAHRDQEAHRVSWVMLAQMVFLVTMVRMEKREIKAIRVHPAHRVLWVQEAYRGNRDHKANKALLVLMESKDPRAKEEKRGHKAHREKLVL
jgi:hypothetical protein